LYNLIKTVLQTVTVVTDRHPESGIGPHIHGSYRGTQSWVSDFASGSGLDSL